MGREGRKKMSEWSIRGMKKLPNHESGNESSQKCKSQYGTKVPKKAFLEKKNQIIRSKIECMHVHNDLFLRKRTRLRRRRRRRRKRRKKHAYPFQVVTGIENDWG
jgi:hypothetical protein